MTHADAHPIDPPMQWNAWGDAAAAKPLSPGIRSLQVHFDPALLPRSELLQR